MLTFLALGDSYTIGADVPPTESWPVQLTAALLAQGIPLTDLQTIAETGWTTDELAVAIAGARRAGELDPRYDLVSLLIGVNNQYRGYSLEEYRLQFRNLLEQAIALAGGRPDHVLALSIPDWGVTPFAAGRDRLQIAAEIDDFNAANRQEAQRRRAHYLDITPLTRQLGANPAMLASDGLHPSGKQYAAWVQFILPVARKILRQASFL